MAAQWEPPAPTRRDPIQPDPSARMLVVPALVGGLVALSLGIYGRLHPATGVAVDIVGFSSPATVKAWLASVAIACALVQVGTSLVMYGKVPGVRAPAWGSVVHRWSGRLAFIVTVPVAVHCLYALGFQSFSPRVLAHSLFGCLFFGAFTVKMLSLTRKDTPAWVLPLLGGLVFVLLAVIWFTSAFWFFSFFGVKR
jgi:hypothetical protein